MAFFLLALFAYEIALEETSITVSPLLRAGIIVVGVVVVVLAVAVGIFINLTQHLSAS